MADPIIDVSAVDADAAEYVTSNADGTVTLTLQFPVAATLRGPLGERAETYDHLTFRRPNGADLRKIGSLDAISASALLVCRLAGVPDKVFDVLDGADAMRASEVVADFLPSSRRAGKTS